MVEPMVEDGVLTYNGQIIFLNGSLKRIWPVNNDIIYIVYDI